MDEVKSTSKMCNTIEIKSHTIAPITFAIKLFPYVDYTVHYMTCLVKLLVKREVVWEKTKGKKRAMNTSIDFKLKLDSTTLILQIF